MKTIRRTGVLIATLGVTLGAPMARAQQPKAANQPPPTNSDRQGALAAPSISDRQGALAAPTIASALDKEFSVVEREVVSAAEAMPEEKYSFVPKDGEFKGVRTFGEQVRHIAAANFMLFGAFYGEKADFEVVEHGPANITTKAQIVQYLKDSFAKGHKAIATITPENAATLVEAPPFSLVNTRLALASFACAHSFDHYGQIVVYLRLNGIVPPASRGGK
jgi:uncharacterized damage-inducible protein DinB